VRRADDRGDSEILLERLLELVDALSGRQEKRVEDGRDRFFDPGGGSRVAFVAPGSLAGGTGLE